MKIIMLPGHDFFILHGIYFLYHLSGPGVKKNYNNILTQNKIIKNQSDLLRNPSKTTIGNPYNYTKLIKPHMNLRSCVHPKQAAIWDGPYPWNFSANALSSKTSMISGSRSTNSSTSGNAGNKPFIMFHISWEISFDCHATNLSRMNK